MRLVPGNEHECPIFYPMLETFVAQVGEGVIRRLLLDRGFIDGERIAHCKRKLGIDILIPVRRDMDIYHDALGLLKLEATKFQEYRESPREPVDTARLPHSPERVRKRELERHKTVEAKKAELAPPPPDEVLRRREVVGLQNLQTFTTCSVPLNVIVNRDVFADGHVHLWMLLDTKPLTPSSGPAARRAEYAIRTDIEEGHRQLKCFWDMTRFTSRAFSLVLNQIVFVLLAYNLLQIFLRAQREPPLSRRSRPRQLDLVMTTAAVIIIYAENRFAILTPLAYTELLLTLGDDARKKVLSKTRRLREELGQALRLARSP
jgi:hypothetical protein